MATTIDACGRSCPEPVLMTKKSISSGEAHYEVLVDNTTAMQNVSRFAQNNGFSVDVQQTDDTYHLLLQKGK